MDSRALQKKIAQNEEEALPFLSTQIDKAVNFFKKLELKLVDETKKALNFLGKTPAKKKSNYYKNWTKLYKKNNQKKIFIDLIEFHYKVIEFKEINIKFVSHILKEGLLLQSRRFHEFDSLLKNSYLQKSDKTEKSLLIIKSVFNKFFPQYTKKDLEDVYHIFRNDRKPPYNDMVFFLTGVFFLAFSLSVFYLMSLDLVKGFFIAILFGYGALFGVCLVIFKKYNINASMIFEFTSYNNFGVGRYFLLVTFFFTLISVAEILLFEKYWKNLIYVIFVVCFFFPVPIVFSQRKYLMFLIYQIFTFNRLRGLNFKEFVVADYLVSMTSLLTFYMQRRSKGGLYDKELIICIIPRLLRILQCMLRYFKNRKSINLWNVFKYFYSICVAVTCGYFGRDSKFFWAANFLVLTSTTLNFYWDIEFDWCFRKKNKTFRPFVYNLAILVNFLCRYFCIIRFFWQGEKISMLSIIIEMFRRSLWVIFRVECEHLNNCDILKASNISLVNVDFFCEKDSTETEATLSESTFDENDSIFKLKMKHEKKKWNREEI